MFSESLFMNLCYVHRFSSMGLMTPDTDAMHTIRMQLYALDMYNGLSDEAKAKVPIESICFRILVHDLDEVVCCDIPRNIKYYSEESKSLISKITEDLLDRSEVCEELITNITESKSGMWGVLISALDIYDAWRTLGLEYSLRGMKKYKLGLIQSKIYLDECSPKWRESDLPLEIKSFLNDLHQSVTDSTAKYCGARDDSCMCT